MEDVINKKEVPVEIYIEIFKNVDEIDDLINLYDTYNNKKIIDDEIIKYLNTKTNESQEKHWLNKVLKRTEYKINNYICENDEHDKNEYLNYIKKMYNKHYIYKFVINFYLTCFNCNVKDINRNYYVCLNCDKTFCFNCCIKCEKCDPFENIFYHCSNCKEYECLLNIKKIINKTQKDFEIEKDIIKKLIIEDYLKEIKTKYCKNMIGLALEEDFDNVFNILNRNFNDE